MDSRELRASYEAVPYESRAITVTHPDRIAAMAMLHGLTPQPVASCRVLELGCASGGNLMPMAVGLPDSTFVGVDFVPEQIATGRATIEALGLSNISLEAMSIADIDDAFGTFDYVICHGVYSWVPPEVQAATLRVCARNLAPNGVAFVSYNTFPGWHLRGIAHDMVRFHDDPTLSAEARAERGRAFVQFVADAAPAHRGSYADLLRQELAMLRTETTSHFLHEQLELMNQPMLFEDFARRAAIAGLQYVAEAQPSAIGSAISPEAIAAIRAWSTDIVRFEQYLDFLRMRTFRQTLLCHSGIAVRPDPIPERLLTLHLVGRCEPVPDGSAEAGRGFRSPEGLTITTNNPIVIAALDCLYRVRPKSLSFGELWQQVGDAVRADPRAAESIELENPLTLAAPLLQCILGRLVEPHAQARRVTAAPSEHPVANALARLQAATPQPVTNLDHAPVALDPLDRFVLARLDGTRDQGALRSELGHALARNAIACDPRVLSDDVGDVLEDSLGRLTRAAFLEA